MGSQLGRRIYRIWNTERVNGQSRVLTKGRHGKIAAQTKKSDPTRKKHGCLPKMVTDSEGSIREFLA